MILFLYCKLVHNSKINSFGVKLAKQTLSPALFLGSAGCQSECKHRLCLCCLYKITLKLTFKLYALSK